MAEILPVNKRPFHAFVSHAHADKAFVDRIDNWLTEVAGLNVWYDGRNFPASALLSTHLGDAINQCRAMIIVLSNRSLNSGWVQEEYNAAIGQRAQFRDYRVIPVRIEECDVPGFLSTTKWIDIHNGEFSIETGFEILAALYYSNVNVDTVGPKDIYISRTWRLNEAPLADQVCRSLVNRNFRLVGDSQDQAGFDGLEEVKRVESIISSCGSLVAILPDRGEGKASPYMLREIEIAQRLELPYAIIAEPTIDLPDDMVASAESILRMTAQDMHEHQDDLREMAIRVDDRWKKPTQPHYIFLATDFDPQYRQRNRAVRSVIQLVTGMACVTGDDIRTGNIRQEIARSIRGAFCVVADISEENINTCIEAGIAWGARRKYHLLAREPRRDPPFMLGDEQVWYYADEVELLGLVHRIMHPYRRRVLNYELAN
jgi:hypothetical protein